MVSEYRNFSACKQSFGLHACLLMPMDADGDWFPVSDLSAQSKNHLHGQHSLESKEEFPWEYK